jgi:hypothetical protein
MPSISFSKRWADLTRTESEFNPLAMSYTFWTLLDEVFLGSFKALS